MENWTTADIADQLEQPEGAGDARRGILVEIRKAQGAIRALAGWVRDHASPVRDFAANEVGSAAVLLAAAVAALVWANSPWSSTYEVVWSSDLSFGLGELEFSQDLRHWINDGLMAFFFFVVGLEIRREFDMGELRDHRRVAIPVLAALGGMAAPALIYLAFNAGAPAAQGWGIVMATDTAFALGALALIGRRFPTRVRVFLLTLVIVDDIGALTVIALGYTQEFSPLALLVAVGLFGVVLGLRQLGVRRGIPYVVVGVGVWLATLESGVHPTIAGVAMGLLATAYPPSRQDLQRATLLWRTFREQPTPRFARSARLGVTEAISPNERLQDLFRTWTSYLVVPLFALANAGVELRGDLLGRALSSPITLGIVFGLVAGKPIGITVASWLASRRRLGGFPLTVAWPPLVGLATLAGIGFTVSLFVADLSFQGEQLEEAKVGILAASILAASLGWLAFRLKHLLPAWVLAAAQARAAEPLMDLADPVDPERDHVRGPEDGLVTLVEYGDFQCPHCGRAEPVVRELLAEFGDDLRYVFRHLPLQEVHENAQVAAEAAEAAGVQGRFWEMYEILLAHQDALDPEDLHRYAEELRLDLGRFSQELRTRTHAPRVARDEESADRSGVAGTPTFFINGRRHHGPNDIDTLTSLVRSTMAQSMGRRPLAAVA
jgi:Na+/H+ antiporter NhaA